MTKQPILETARLILRPFTPVDAPDVKRLAGEWEIADTTLNIPHPYEDGMAEKWITTHQPEFEKGQSVHFAITLRLAGELCGAIGLVINPEFSRAELGYWIGAPYWGQGICTEAAEVVLQYAFQEKGLHRIFALHFKRNPASGRVMQKIGMIYEGCLRQHVRKWEVYEDLMLYGILEGDWREDKARRE